ncbi:MAG: F0F1 ATP synthase subunit A [Pseudobdellovibrionaceae bacterium]
MAAAHPFSWFNLVPGVGHEFSHIATVATVSVGLVAVGLYARKALGAGDVAVIPEDKVSVRGVFESITEMIADLADLVIGHHGRKYVPMFAAIFLFVLVNNFMGFIPGVLPATENINTTFALGIFSFIGYNYYGVKEHGLAYFKHFLGPYLPLFIIMLPIEIISNLLRPLTLGLRLANVMMGDHIVTGVFLDLAPPLAPIPFFMLGMLVCLIQAFVFTILSMVYVAMATAHEEH